MAINIRKFELESEFISVYNGDEYIEPWVSLCTETSGVAYDKVYLKEIEIKNLKMVGNVPASGATVNKDNCTYVVNAVYSNYSREDITVQAEVTGSLVVEASQIEERHSAGTLTLVAEYSGLTGSADVTVYQEKYSNYLKFNILSGGNIAFGAVADNDANTATPLTIEYKKNDGEWTSLTSTVIDNTTNPGTPEDMVNALSSKFSVDAGDVVMFRGDNQAYAFLSSEGWVDNFNAFFSTASFNVEGNIMSLIVKNNFLFIFFAK